MPSNNKPVMVESPPFELSIKDLDTLRSLLHSSNRESERINYGHVGTYGVYCNDLCKRLETEIAARRLEERRAGRKPS